MGLEKNTQVQLLNTVGNHCDVSVAQMKLENTVQSKLKHLGLVAQMPLGIAT